MTDVHGQWNEARYPAQRGNGCDNFKGFWRKNMLTKQRSRAIMNKSHNSGGVKAVRCGIGGVFGVLSSMELPRMDA